MTEPVSAGIIPVRRTEAGWRVLVLRAYRNWDFPKGLIEPGEEPLAAARREAAEEADLGDLSFPFGTAYIDTAPYSGGKTARYYLAETRRVVRCRRRAPIRCSSAATAAETEERGSPSALAAWVKLSHSTTRA